MSTNILAAYPNIPPPMVEFHSWLTTRPIEDQRLYRKCFVALVVDLDISIERQEQKNADNQAPTTPKTQGENDSASQTPQTSAIPSPANATADTASLSSLRIPRLRSYQQSEDRSSAAVFHPYPSPAAPSDDEDSDVWTTTDENASVIRHVSSGTIVHTGQRRINSSTESDADPMVDQALKYGNDASAGTAPEHPVISVPPPATDKRKRNSAKRIGRALLRLLKY